MDICNYLSAVVIGMTLKDIGPTAILQGKKIPILIFLAVITSFFYILGYEIQARIHLIPKTPSYTAVEIMMNIMDMSSAIPYVYALISRLVAIMPLNEYRNYLYIWMIVPILYPIVDIYDILLLLNFPLDPTLASLLYAIGNIAFGITFFFLDLLVTAWLYQYKSRQELVDCFPLVAGILYIANAMAAALDPNIDTSPFYLAYVIDIFAFQQVSRRLSLAVGRNSSNAISMSTSMRERSNIRMEMSSDISNL
ncbi:hypothetical protein HDV01_001628 [Terramyces sp. JEL0728]|nr:hypothetical protein HDV01_001628 [Terramyces sp. JEL0728]